MPFAHETSTRLQSKARIWTDPACRPEHLCQRLELTARRLAEPAVLNFLLPVSDPAN
jgi:hypothetical protein